VTGADPRAGPDPAPALVRVVTGLPPAAGDPLAPCVALVRVVTGAEAEPEPPLDDPEAAWEPLVRVVIPGVPAAAELPLLPAACALAPVLTVGLGPSA
jgi:hypothetical protein